MFVLAGYVNILDCMLHSIVAVTKAPMCLIIDGFRSTQILILRDKCVMKVEAIVMELCLLLLFVCLSLLVIVDWICGYSVPEIIATFGNPYSLLYRQLEKEINFFESDPYWRTGGNSVVSCMCFREP